MRFCCVVVVLTSVYVLAGCLVAQAAPRRGGGESNDPRWKRNFSPQWTENSASKRVLVERILDILQQRMTGNVDLSQINSRLGNQERQQLDLQRYWPIDQEEELIEDDDEVPNRAVIKRKCIGRFQPYNLSWCNQNG